MDTPKPTAPHPVPEDFDTLREQVANLTAALRDLYTRQPNGNATSANPSPALSRHLNKPPEFDGKDKSFCSTFLSHLRLYISGNPALFPDERSKIVFAASYLRGSAFTWFEPHLQREDDSLLRSFNFFANELQRNLGDPDQERTVTRQLQALTQTASAASYSTSFFRLSSYLDWNDEALRAQFYTGLKPEVKDALALSNQDPETVQDLSQLAIRLDNRIHERKIDSRRGPSRPQPQASTFTRPPQRTFERKSNGPAPMDLDGTKVKKFQPLTDQEKKRRRDNNLCLYCGAAGHKVSECPSRTPPRQLKATTSTPVSFSLSDDNSGKD